MNARREDPAARRARLVARADSERRWLAERLAPVAAFDDGVARIARIPSRHKALAAGLGLGLGAVMLLMPGTRGRALRTGFALVHLAGSVRRLISHVGV